MVGGGEKKPSGVARWALRNTSIPTLATRLSCHQLDFSMRHRICWTPEKNLSSISASYTRIHKSP